MGGIHMRFWDSARRNVLAGRYKRLGVGGMALACIALAGAVVAYATQIVNNPDTTVRFLSPNKPGVRQISGEIWVGCMFNISVGRKPKLVLHMRTIGFGWLQFLR